MGSRWVIAFRWSEQSFGTEKGALVRTLRLVGGLLAIIDDTTDSLQPQLDDSDHIGLRHALHHLLSFATHPKLLLCNRFEPQGRPHSHKVSLFAFQHHLDETRADTTPPAAHPIASFRGGGVSCGGHDALDARPGPDEWRGGSRWRY